MESDYVTMEKADSLIRRAKPLMEAARRLKREIETIAAGYDYDRVLLEQGRTRIEGLAQRLARKLEKLEEMGCYVKDLDIGIVDFLCRFEGRDVFLCWKLGEPRVTHWHEINEGFAHRQAICDLTQLELDWFEIPMLEKSAKRQEG